MNTNIGPLDRAVRVIIGVALIAYAIPYGFPETGWNWIGSCKRVFRERRG